MRMAQGGGRPGQGLSPADSSGALGARRLHASLCGAGDHWCAGLREMSTFTESTVEEAARSWLESIGWQLAHGPDIAPDMPAAERRNYGEGGLAQRLRDALARMNPAVP